MNYHSKLALGTVQFGLNYGISNPAGQTSLVEVKNILRIAKENKITTIDTASAYGESEKVLGEVGVGEFEIITKFIANNSSELNNQFENSLSNLKVDNIYAYMAHRPFNIFNDLEIWKTLQLLKSENKIQKIGFSFNSVEEIKKMFELNITPDIIQIPFNILDSRFSKYAKELKQKGTEIHSRSTFLQGLFFLDEQKLESKFLSVKEFVTDLQKQLEDDLANYLLFYVSKQNFIDKIVLGVNNSKQLISNLEFKNFENIELSLPKKIEDEVIIPSLWKK